MNNINIGKIITAIGLVGLAILLAIVDVYAVVIDYTSVTFYKLKIIMNSFKMPFFIITLIIVYGVYLLVKEFLDYIKD